MHRFFLSPVQQCNNINLPPPWGGKRTSLCCPFDTQHVWITGSGAAQSFYGILLALLVCLIYQRERRRRMRERVSFLGGKIWILNTALCVLYQSQLCRFSDKERGARAEGGGGLITIL